MMGKTRSGIIMCTFAVLLAADASKRLLNDSSEDGNCARNRVYSAEEVACSFDGQWCCWYDKGSTEHVKWSLSNSTLTPEVPNPDGDGFVLLVRSGDKTETGILWSPNFRLPASTDRMLMEVFCGDGSELDLHVQYVEGGQKGHTQFLPEDEEDICEYEEQWIKRCFQLQSTDVWGEGKTTEGKTMTFQLHGKVNDRPLAIKDIQFFKNNSVTSTEDEELTTTTVASTTTTEPSNTTSTTFESSSSTITTTESGNETIVTQSSETPTATDTGPGNETNTTNTDSSTATPFNRTTTTTSTIPGNTTSTATPTTTAETSTTTQTESPTRNISETTTATSTLGNTTASVTTTTVNTTSETGSSTEVREETTTTSSTEPTNSTSNLTTTTTPNYNISSIKSLTESSTRSRDETTTVTDIVTGNSTNSSTAKISTETTSSTGTVSPTVSRTITTTTTETGEETSTTEQSSSAATSTALAHHDADMKIWEEALLGTFVIFCILALGVATVNLFRKLSRRRKLWILRKGNLDPIFPEDGFGAIKMKVFAQKS